MAGVSFIHYIHSVIQGVFKIILYNMQYESKSDHALKRRMCMIR